MGESATASVTFLLRLDPDRRLVVELDALFGYSVCRALQSLERTEGAEYRMAITRRVIEPLERARSVLSRAAQRRGRARERLLLPADVVELAEMQYRALCQATGNENFPWDELPEPLRNPFAASDRLLRVLGRRAGQGRRLGWAGDRAS
jgi:hypothetical protein